jgi:4-hydroxy-tetrahydrodipicolinate synthase
VKDAKSDLIASSAVMAATDLAYYSGEDALTLAFLSIGAVGVVGTSTHFCGPETRALVDAALAGDPAEALRLHRQLLPIFTGIFATQGAILVKAGLELQGRGVGGVRLPLVPATAEQRAALGRALEASGLASGPSPVAG